MPKTAGFKWDDAAKHWYTDSLRAAVGLREYATPEAKSKLSERLITISPWPDPLPAESGDLFKHQIDALQFALGRSASYLALDPGLGKTAVAALAASAHARREAGLIAVVYVTPPFLVKNIQREFSRWAPELRMSVLTSKTSEHDHTKVSVLILPDTFVAATWLKLVLKEFTAGLPSRLLIVDEAHRFKNDTAQRTRAVVGHGKTAGIAPLFNTSILMSGTPMPNRPIELFPVLNCFAPETISFRNKFEFGERYCAAILTDMGWDFSGASNLQELRKNLVAPDGPYMLRMSKDDVLDLPPKIEQVFLLSADLPPKLAPLDFEIAKAYSSGDDLMRAKLAATVDMDGHELSTATYRRLLGEYKAKDVLPYLKSILEETNESILVFAFHKSPVALLAEGLKEYDPFVITGQTPVKDRQPMVEAFQADPRKRVFIGNYLAMGTGFTLTRADRVVFVEYSWVPGENSQASDRPHRIGRVGTVLVQYVTYQGSLDEAVIRTNLNKRRTINHI